LNSVCETQQIPTITHKIWLSNPDHVSMPRIQYINTCKRFYESFDDKWTHIFWVNCVEVRDYISSAIPRNNVEVRLLTLTNGALYFGTEFFNLSNNIIKLINNRNFTFACDHLRIEIIEKYGGVYSDLGLEFKSGFNPSNCLTTHAYSFMMSHDGSLFFQNQLLTGRKHDRFYRVLIEICKNPSMLPVEFEDDLSVACGIMITLLYIVLIAKSSDRVFVFVANTNLISITSQQSWYKSKGADNTGSRLATDGGVLINNRVNYDSSTSPLRKIMEEWASLK
jgi:hypothetical protein